jgi:serine/threonine protein kinase
MGVGYLHFQKVIHRDLKCLNIFLTDDMVIKIGDLGVSKIHQTNAGAANLFDLGIGGSNQTQSFKKIKIQSN